MKNDKLKAARERSGKTQKQAAKELGIFTQAYQQYEYGAGTTTIQTAIKIAKMYNTTVENLWGDNPAKVL